MTIKEPISSSEPTYSSPYSTSYSEPVAAEYPTASYATSTQVPEPSLTTSSVTPSAEPTKSDGLFNPSTVNPLVSDEHHWMKGRWEMTKTKNDKGFFHFTKAQLVSTQIGQSYFEERWDMSGKYCWCCPWSDISTVKTIPTSDTKYEEYLFKGLGNRGSPDLISGSISDGPTGKILEAEAKDGTKSTITFQGRNQFLLELSSPGDAYTWSMEMMRRS